MNMRFHHKIMVVAALAALVGIPLFSGLALAATDQHVQALVHAKEAVAQGKQGHTDALVQHAEEALTNAEAAKKNPHMDEGIKQLKEAVAFGKQGKTDMALKHAEGAVTHLSEVK